MAELTVDTTYGSALLQVSKELGKEQQILEEATAVLEVFDRDPKLFKLLQFPGISPAEKKEVLEKVFQDKICRELLNLLFVLVDKKRMRNFPKMIRAYKNMLDKEAGFAYGTIYSVEPLTRPQLKQFEEQTSKLLQIKTKLENKLDPGLMGGAKVLVDGRIIDVSIRKRFSDLESQLMKQ